MSYIHSYGIALPKFRITDSTLNPAVPQKKSTAKAVCFPDEDIITLAFEAASECLKNSLPLSEIDAVLFSSSTPVFHNRYHASFLAALLNLQNISLALDFTNSTRCGTDALLMASNLIDSDKYKNILIISSDVDFPETRSELEPFGHGACAILLSHNGIAEIKHSSSYSSAMAEEYFYKGKPVQYDPRFSREQGFKNNITSAIKSFVKNPAVYNSIILNSRYARMAGGIFMKGGFEEKQFSKDILSAKIGNTGSSHALFLLLNELENATHTDHKILLVDYANGSNLFEIHKTSSINSTAIQQKISNSEFVTTYQDYLKVKKSCDFSSFDHEKKDMFTSEMMNLREKENLIFLNGFECENCNTIYITENNRCKNCKGDKFSRKQLNRTGTIFSFTHEHYFPATFPPVTMAIVDLDGGGRITVQQTDTMYPQKNMMNMGLPVKLVLRKMIENSPKPDYFWKCVPIQ